MSACENERAEKSHLEQIQTLYTELTQAYHDRLVGASRGLESVNPAPERIIFSRRQPFGSIAHLLCIFDQALKG